MTQRLTNYLVYDFWNEYSGTRPRKFFDDGPFEDADGQMRLTYYFSDLVPDRVREATYRALEEWSKATGIEFVEQDSIGAQISFWRNSDWEDRAFAIFDKHDRDGQFDKIHSSSVVTNNSTIFLSDQALFEVMLEEIGHALGLGHGGPYNGTDGAPIFAEDKHSVTVMSYTKDLPIAGLQEADYAAAAILYEPQPISIGDDVHIIDGDLHFHIEDHAGNDRIEWHPTEENRVLDARPGGVTNQASIGQTTHIEHVEVLNPEVTAAVIFDDRIEVHLAGWELIIGDGGWTLTFDGWGWGG